TSPPTPAKIKAMLPKLADLPKEAETKAKTEAELRTEIRSLQAKLREQPKPEIKTVVMGGPVRKPITVDDLNEVLMPIAIAHNEIVQARVETLRKSITDVFHKTFKEPFIVKDWKDRLRRAAQKLNGSKIPSGEFKKENPRVAVPVLPPVRRDQPPRLEQDGEVKLIAGARRMLAAAATFYPKGITEGQMAAQSGVSRSGGSFGTYKSSLKTQGMIQEIGGLYFATQAGMDYLGENIQESPTDTQGVLNLWKPKFVAGARRMLDVLIELGGEPISYEELSEKAGVSVAGGS